MVCSCRTPSCVVLFDGLYAVVFWCPGVEHRITGQGLSCGGIVFAKGGEGGRGTEVNKTGLMIRQLLIAGLEMDGLANSGPEMCS